MPVVKKLKFDIDGDGTITEIKISINSVGEFSADVPMYVKSATHSVVVGLPTMHEAISLVNDIIAEYQKCKEIEKWVILIEFKRDNTPFINQGVSMRFNYLVALKTVFGKSVTYYLISKDMDGKWQVLGNRIETSRYSSFDKGVIAGESLELDFTEEKYASIKDLHDKLELLCDKLSEICNSETKLMELFDNSNKLKLLN